MLGRRMTFPAPFRSLRARAPAVAARRRAGWSSSGGPLLIALMAATRVAAQDAGSAAQGRGSAALDAGLPPPAAGPTGADTAPPPPEQETAEQAPEATAQAEATRPEPPPDEEASRVEAARDVLRNAHIGQLAARTRAALQAARPLFRTTAEIRTIQRLLPVEERTMRRLGHPSRLERLGQLSQRELTDLSGEWSRHRDTFQAWAKALSDRAEAIERARTELVELRRTWARLRNATRVAEVGEARAARIRTSLAETRRTARALDEKRDAMLELEDRVSALWIGAEDVVERIRAATGENRARLLVRDHPPVWRGLSGEQREATSWAAQMGAGLASRTETPRELLSALLPRLVQLLFFFALLSGGLVALYRRQRVSGTEGKAVRRYAPARVITQRWLATASLLTLVILPLWVRPAPVVVYDLAFFALLPALARVLAPLSPARVRPLLYGAMVYLAVNRIHTTLPEGSAVLRAVLLVEASLAVLLVALWARRPPPDKATARVRGVAVAYAIVIAGGLLANVDGWLFLATVIDRGTGYSLAAGLCLLAVLLIARGVLSLFVESELGRRLHTLRDHGPAVYARCVWLGTLAAFGLWVAATLEGYGVWDPVYAQCKAWLAAPRTLGTLEISMGAIFFAVLVLVVTWATVKFVRFVLELDVLPRLSLEPGVGGAISGLTRYILGGTGLLLALSALGINADRIALVAGALGVGIGFGLQGIVANFIAGIVLMIERPVRLGDFIEIGPLIGSVTRIGLRSSTVQALDGAEVIVPNENLISRDLVNWTLSDRRRRVEVKVGVAYGTPPAQALQVIRTVADNHPEIIEGVPPQVLFLGFGESSLDFALHVWVRSFADGIRLRSELGLAVHDALVVAGIEIPFPQRDLHLKSAAEGLFPRPPPEPGGA